MAVIGIYAGEPTMKSDAGKTDSIWTVDSGYSCRRHLLTEDVETNVCIVGAGIAGMTTAYLLAKEGLSVIVLDDGVVAGGETGRTTAHLSFALDDRFTELERLHGERGAQARGRKPSALPSIRSNRSLRDERIDCDFLRLDGYLFLGPGQDCAI